MVGSFGPANHRRGITLTEVLISILILGVGMVAVASLFPLGLLRLRDAARYSRTAYLLESSASDMESRGLLNKQSFFFADMFNIKAGLPTWFVSPYQVSQGAQSPFFDPFTQDTAAYGLDPLDPNNISNNPAVTAVTLGLPVAYDPLWRSQTISTANGTPGYYLGDTYEARFGSGIGFIRNDPFDGGVPSAHGLQRLTNFNRPSYINALGQTVPLMPVSTNVPNIFVSPEDVVWVQSAASNPISPVLPDLNVSAALAGQQINDWHYSWMFTGQQTGAPFQGALNSNVGATFDGNIVIFENRPFGISVPPVVPFNPGAFQAYQVAGETVVEAVWGFGSNLRPAGGTGWYAAGADRTVLLRWPVSMNDPVVRVGDWIADVTYERQANVVWNQNLGTGRFYYNVRFNNKNVATGYANPVDNLEWDDLPPQRCFWYQVQRVVPPISGPAFQGDPQPYRSMVVYVNSSLQCKTVLKGNTEPLFLNAALISPYVINVIPQTIAVR
jgi:hypothetical protein